MSNPIRILAFAGSLRRDSWNKKLVHVAAEGARAAGAEVTVLDLRDVAMPLYDGDIESSTGIPEAAKRFKQMLLAHQGLLIASPEYNSSISGVLKNAIDWASRAEPGEKPLVCFDGKVAGLVAASPGALGGLRGLVTLRSILGNIRVLVVPEQVAVSKANEAFDAEGKLRDVKQAESVRNVGARVAAVARALQAQA
jgi:NAD(P)H-dependent FMN reductase